MGRIILSICAVVVAMAISEDATHAQEAEEGNREPPAKSSERRPLPLSDDGQRQTEAREKAAQNQREDRDLAAQEAMATAALDQVGEVSIQTWLLGLSVLLGGVALIVSTVAVIVTMGTGRRQLRAYLIADPKGVLDLGESKLQAVIQITNVGQTPAYDIHSWGTTWVRPIDEAFDPSGAEPGTVRESDHMVGPGRDFNIYGTFGPISDEDAVAIRDGSKALFSYGVVTYKDTFGKPHFVRFCHYYRGPELNEEAVKYWPRGNTGS